MPDLLRTEGNERLDLSDFQFVSESVRDHGRHLGAQFLAKPTGNRAWVIEGFGITDPAVGKQVEVTRGRALLALRDGANVLYGFVTTEGDATKIVDLTGQPAGTYNVYIRFEFVDGATGSRVFWNAAGSGSEFAQTIATRKQAQWSLRVEQGTPGSEWLKIGEVDQATMAITDQRPFYFEGDPSASYATTWGAGNDRNADRQQYGVTDLQTFTEAMRTALEDIKGPGLRRWWDPDIGGMTIGHNGTRVEHQVSFRDSSFNVNHITNGLPTIEFDGSDNRIRFNRGNEWWDFDINGINYGRLTPSLVIWDGDDLGLGWDWTTSITPRCRFNGAAAYISYNIAPTNQFNFFAGANIGQFENVNGETRGLFRVRHSTANQSGFCYWDSPTRRWVFGVAKSEATAGDQDFFDMEWLAAGFDSGLNKRMQFDAVELDLALNNSVLRLNNSGLGAVAIIGDPLETNFGTPAARAFRLKVDDTPSILGWEATYDQVLANNDSLYEWDFAGTDTLTTRMRLAHTGGASGALLTVFGQVYATDLSQVPANSTHLRAHSAAKAILAWGIVDSAGGIQTPHYNVASAVRNSAGDYTVTLDVGVDTNSVVIATGANLTLFRVCIARFVNGTTIDIEAFDSAFANVDQDVSFVVIGTT